MKKDTHPPYQKVLFVDSASGHRFVCGSALQPEAKEVFQGEEYPVCYLSISSTSHPFFTGSKQLVDSEGRVEKFKRRFEKQKELAPKNEEGSSQEQPSKEKQEKKGSDKGTKAKAPKKK